MRLLGLKVKKKDGYLSYQPDIRIFAKYFNTLDTILGFKRKKKEEQMNFHMNSYCYESCFFPEGFTFSCFVYFEV